MVCRLKFSRDTTRAPCAILIVEERAGIVHNDERHPQTFRKLLQYPLQLLCFSSAVAVNLWRGNDFNFESIAKQMSAEVIADDNERHLRDRHKVK